MKATNKEENLTCVNTEQWWKLETSVYANGKGSSLSAS
jgi:hypothetical protein